MAVVVTMSAMSLPARAALFEDEEARKAILDVRAKLEAKADKTSVLELASQIEALRQEVAKLRGQNEVMANELANAQRRQKDFYVELDSRTRKLEPQQMVIDGKDVIVGPAEQQAYDAAMAQFKAGNYKGAAKSLGDFVKRYPKSGYAASAQYFLGSSFYALRDYRNAISAQSTLLKQYPDSSRVPDAMLNIASCYAELKDKMQAKKWLERVIAQHPKSEAAKTARERLK